MSTTTKSRTAVLLLGGAAALGIAFAHGQTPRDGAGQPAAPATTAAQPEPAAKGERSADEAGVRKALAAFAAAFQAGDAKAVGTLFTLFVLPCVYSLLAKPDAEPQAQTQTAPAH